jgi:hypothetical protein
MAGRSKPTPSSGDASKHEQLTQRYAGQIFGTLGCRGRVILTGTLTVVCHAGARWRDGCAGTTSAVSI